MVILSLQPGSNAKRVGCSGCLTAPTTDPPRVTTSWLTPSKPGLWLSMNLPLMVTLPAPLIWHPWSTPPAPTTRSVPRPIAIVP